MECLQCGATISELQRELPLCVGCFQSAQAADLSHRKQRREEALKGAIPARELIEIAPGIFLGDEVCAAGKQKLDELQITHILGKTHARLPNGEQWQEFILNDSSLTTLCILHSKSTTVQTKTSPRSSIKHTRSSAMHCSMGVC
jgi:hypothetical protein